MKVDGQAKLTPEGRVDGEGWLRDRLIQQIDELTLNQILMYVGPPGSGKSYTCLRVNELVDPSFSVERVVFPAVDFVRTIADKSLKARSAITWDDAGLGMPARTWWDFMNQAAGYIFQSYRFRRLLTGITLADPTFLDSQPRKLYHILLVFLPRMRPGDSAQARVYLTEHNPRIGKVYTKRPIVDTPRGRVTLKTIRFALPSHELLEQYEPKKREYLMAFYQDLLRQAESTDLTGRHVDPVRVRMLLTIARYGDQLGKTHIEIARDLEVHEESFGRALRQARKAHDAKLASVMNPTPIAEAQPLPP